MAILINTERSSETHSLSPQDPYVTQAAQLLSLIGTGPVIKLGYETFPDPGILELGGNPLIPDPENLSRG